MLTKNRLKPMAWFSFAALVFVSCGSDASSSNAQRAASEGFSSSPTAEVVSDEAADEPSEPVDPELVTAAPDIDTETNPDGVGPGDDLPLLADVLGELAFDGPCALFTDSELADLVGSSAESAGLMDELPFGLGGSPLTFTGVTSTPSACEWFSDEYFWYVGISWEPAEASFVDAVFEGGDEFGSGYRAVLINDTEAQLAQGDLLITISNLPPSHESVTSDALVTRALLEAVSSRIS